MGATNAYATTSSFMYQHCYYNFFIAFGSGYYPLLDNYDLIFFCNRLDKIVIILDFLGLMIVIISSINVHESFTNINVLFTEQS